MNLVERAQADIAKITGNSSEFGTSVPVVMSPPGGDTEISFTGIHTKHHKAFDVDTGLSVNSKVSSVAVSEIYLSEQDYPVRNAAGEVSLSGHLVTVSDSTGLPCRYMVRESYADEMVGLIVMILGDFE